VCESSVCQSIQHDTTAVARNGCEVAGWMRMDTTTAGTRSGKPFTTVNACTTANSSTNSSNNNPSHVRAPLAPRRTMPAAPHYRSSHPGSHQTNRSASTSMWPDDTTTDIDIDLTDMDIDTDDLTALLPIHVQLKHVATQTEPLGADACVQTEQTTQVHTHTTYI
jgi:hypothetical protein